MNKLSIKLATTVAIFGAMFSLNAVAAPVTDSGASAVTIVSPLTVTANDDMNFGAVVKPDSGTQTVILGSNGTVSGGTAQALSTIATSAGTVSIAGDSSQTVSVTLSDDANVGGLEFTNFTSETFGGQSISGFSLTGATLTGGTDTLTLGATLSIASSVAPSATPYNPSYTVSVDYN